MTMMSDSEQVEMAEPHRLADTAMMAPDLSDEPSSPESSFDEGDLLDCGVNDEVTAQLMAAVPMISDAGLTDDESPPDSPSYDDADLLHATDEMMAQLAAAGPIGVAAAAAIATGKKRKRPHSFETNPSIRKRQQTRLLRKLKNTIDEYTTRVGQQAVVLCCTPGKPSQSSQSYKVFGSQPLENVVRNVRPAVMQDLESCLAQQAPPAQPDNPALHELPPLVIDGIPTPVDKMTQAQLRAFIPEMLKYSTGRSKPGWGKPECRPIWWPHDVPWANVRSDVRTEEEKKKVSWTHALRCIVKNCYKHHGREDLLPDFDDVSLSASQHHQYVQQTMVQTINNPDGTVSIIQIDTGDVNNPQIVTLADGTQAQVVHTIGPLNGVHEASQAVQTLADVAASHQDIMGHGNVAVEVNNDATAQAVATLAEATINSEGQLILTSDPSGLAGQFISSGGISGMVTIPVSMYQTVVTSMSQLQDSPHSQAVRVAMAPNAEQQANGEVPDATHAVEVMTIEPSVT